jgi:hypothetical protein
VGAGSVDDIVVAVERLWNDRALCDLHGDNGRKFVAKNCTEEAIAEHFEKWLALDPQLSVRSENA